MDPFINHFSEEALKAQQGKKVPLKLEPGGPVIGEATLRYDPGTGSLNADLQVDDPKIKELLKADNPNLSSVIFKRED